MENQGLAAAPSTDKNNNNTNPFSVLPLHFVYALIILLIFWLSTRVFTIGASHVFALLVAAGLISHMDANVTAATTKQLDEFDAEYELLDTPSHFYRDVNFVRFFASLYPFWRPKNPSNFDLAVKCANNVLLLESDIVDHHVLHPVHHYEIAREQSLLSLNYMHSFIYSIDTRVEIDALKHVMARLQQLLERHLEIMRTYCAQVNNKRRLNPDTRFIQEPGPMAYDPVRDTDNFQFY